MSEIRTCKNIYKEIKNYATKHNIETRECDFSLLALSTYLKSVHLENFIKLDSTYKKEYATYNKIINDHVRFQQVYKINIFQKEPSDIELHYTLKYDEFKTETTLHVEPTSIINHLNYKPSELYKLLVKKINAIKAKHNILINLFSDSLQDQIKRWVKALYSSKFTKTLSLNLCKTFEPIIAQEAKLILHFEENKESNQEYKEIEIDELIIEYTKPIFGENGLNVYGRRIISDAKKSKNLLTFIFDEKAVLRKEDDKAIYFYALKKGYVEFANDKLSIENKIKRKRFSRNESKLTQDETNDVEIVLSQNNLHVDTLSEGAELKSESIHIEGYVGRNAKVEAKELVINGVTHNGSKVFSKEATIHRHKGLLRCHKANVHLLEGGEIHATEVYIDSAIGGSIYAQDVHVKELRSNVKIYASSSIYIDNLIGEDNILAIDYQKIPIIMKRIEFIKEDIELLIYTLEKAKRHDDQRAASIQKKITLFKEEVTDLQESMYHASIEINSIVTGVNKIIFSTPYGELSYNTTNHRYSTFTLENESERIILLPTQVSLTK